MRNWIAVLVIGLVLISGSPVNSETTYTPDVDLKSAPASYRKRVIEFRNILRKEKTREKQIKKAIDLTNKPKSKYRIDAIEFLGEIRSLEALPTLISAAKDPEVRQFAIFALGEVRDAKAIPTLIDALSDEDDNVRGNAGKAIQKMIKTDFGFRFNDPTLERETAINRIKEWWKTHQATFKVREETPEEKKEAEDAWQKYGKQYIHDLTR